ncbi:LysR family transcriptional regulator [Amycolatopsis acidiphila]|uniref:LysR family transcriptional regulator n=1 Tax=Amycolatopsis acidiphila TaxID=715473 RepID=A0A558AFE6_9PSEU|nr:LysR family transcriptional regulator [Amycolatopsis acidiphila]TVT22982.1 LysR family transcriptional regulator [Amycolatopsis acidiphila]UIJ57145.1 LysR family transcriptional regulator [Amycolatopsis acidiphila]GHG53084.1 LysR family transcriptional regulator [Amycolatopsis acidiphila]
MNLDLYRLLVFVTVVDRNGYSAAARPLNLAQPTVSHHVSELERACGTELLHYQDRAVHLTAAGHEVYRTALVMLAEQDRLKDSLGDLAQGRRGRVRLGASMAFEQQYFFDEVVAPFRRSYEGTLLSVRFGHSRREAQAVLDRELDLAYVIRWHLPGEARFEALQQMRLVFLASRAHPLAGRTKVTVDDIGEYGLITAPLTGVETGFYREVLRRSGLTGDHSVLEVGGLQARFLAAAASLGVIATFVPDHPRDIVFADLVPLRVDGPRTTVEVGLVRRDGDPKSRSTDALACRLRELARKR